MIKSAWFNRHEVAGAFGDAGTDIPLLVGMCLAAGLDGTSVLVVFGVLQIASGLLYRMPMPVQPLKAMAALVIAQQATAEQLYGGGLAIGLIMLVLALSGALDRLARWVPHCVVRGVQFGLGLQLAGVALTKFVQADGARGYGLAALAFLITIFLLASRRFPAALLVFAVGLAYAFVWKLDLRHLTTAIEFRLPQLQSVSMEAVLSGLVVLALPQLPLSLANSVLATQKLAHDLFPERPLSLRRLGCTYGLMNLIAPWFGGVPACHGSGGLAGHFAFGGRSGGSVLVYGSLLLLLGLFFGGAFDQVALVFPLPMLGVVLLFEALALVWLVRDVSNDRTQFPITLIVGVIAVGLPYGFVIGLVVGVGLWHMRHRTHLVSPDA
jgi:MFS superfamily sulfate permease-like transporter